MIASVRAFVTVEVATLITPTRCQRRETRSEQQPAGRLGDDLEGDHVIAAIVDPLFFTMDKKTGDLLELVGRTLPKRKDGDKFKDLDVEIVYKN